MEKLLYKASEAADILGTTRQSIAALYNNGALKAVHKGTRLMIPAKELERFAEEWSTYDLDMGSDGAIKESVKKLERIKNGKGS